MQKPTDGSILTIDTEKKFGLDEAASEYQNTRWCYDTPGTVQPDQILHFLTTDELMKTLHYKMISPRTFCIWPSQAIFIAGLGRLDILSSSSYVRYVAQLIIQNSELLLSIR